MLFSASLLANALSCLAVIRRCWWRWCATGLVVLSDCGDDKFKSGDAAAGRTAVEVGDSMPSCVTVLRSLIWGRQLASTDENTTDNFFLMSARKVGSCASALSDITFAYVAPLTSRDYYYYYYYYYWSFHIKKISVTRDYVDSLASTSKFSASVS